MQSFHHTVEEGRMELSRLLYVHITDRTMVTSSPVEKIGEGSPVSRQQR